MKHFFKFIENKLGITDKILQKEMYDSLSKKFKNIDEIARNFENTTNKYFEKQGYLNQITSTEIGKYRHIFLKKYGGEILKMHCQYKMSPLEILNSVEFKHLKDKPVKKTIEMYLKNEGHWSGQETGKTNQANAFQKSRSSIKKLFDEGLKYTQIEEIINTQNNDYNISLFTIKKYCEKLADIESCKKAIMRNSSGGISNAEVFNRLKSTNRYKKIISINLIKTTRKENV